MVSSRRAGLSQTIARILSSVRTNSDEMWVELDSHADTTCAGANCIVIETTNQVVDVTPYNRKHGSLKASRLSFWLKWLCRDEEVKVRVGREPPVRAPSL